MSPHSTKVLVAVKANKSADKYDLFIWFI